MHLKPITPLEPISTESIPGGKQWISQVKWDGVRILTYYDGNNVQLFNRRQNERTFHYPEIGAIQSYCTAESVILDGEMIALGGDGKPSFSKIMQRDGIRRLERVKQVGKNVPIHYMIFDVVFLNGDWTNQLPLEKRLQVLREIIKPSNQVQVVPSYTDGQALFRAIIEQDMEGIVIKDLKSTYAPNGKDKRWQKKKAFKELCAIVGGVTHRAGRVNALLLGLYDEHGELWYIGHAGTGKLTQQDWQKITDIVRLINIPKRPFVNMPERSKEATWVKPELSVEINFLEWTRMKTLRQPSIQSYYHTAQT